MVNKEVNIHPVTGDILNIPVMHDRIYHPISQKLLIHTIEYLLPLHRSERDTKVTDYLI